MLRSSFEGETRIFRKDLENGKVISSTTLNQKNTDGEWEKIYIDVVFKKDVEVQDKQDIYINNAWLRFYKRENGLIKFLIFVNDFNYIDTNESDLPF